MEPDVDTFINDNLNLVLINELNVYRELSNIKVSKASGPNDIPGYVLKNCASSLSKSLTILFNFVLSSGFIPSDWKCAKVVLILKKEIKNLLIITDQ